MITKSNGSTKPVSMVHPSQDAPIRAMTKTALFAALLCILAPLSIPIGPVPISLTNLVIYFALYLLGVKKGTAAYLVYILLGLAGLPVFSGFQGGPGKLFGVTGGYIFGFILMAVIAGIFIEHFPEKTGICVLAMILGTAVCYLFGTIWFIILAKCTVGYAMGICVLPFIPGDLIKIGLAASLAPLIRKRLIQSGLY